MPNPRFTPPFTAAQQQFLALCPKFTSVPSIVGSMYIVQHVLRSPQRRQRVYTRLLVGMCSMDWIYAIKCFVSTWPLPASTNAFGAVGTTQTCTAAAFWGQGASLSSALYNGSLTLYYLLTIRHGWTQSRFQGRWEILLHAIPLLIGWGTAIASLPLDLMNPIGWTCWIGPWPLGCEGDACVRGRHAKLYRWAFFHAILWATFAFVAVSMGLIFCKIRTDEKASQRYRYNTNNSSNKSSRRHSFATIMTLSTRRSLFGRSDNTRPHDDIEASDDFLNPQEHSMRASLSSRPKEKQLLSKRFAQQACYYILAFFLAWVWPMAQFAVTNAPGGTLYYPLLALTVLINPLQGAFNALIYLRPRYLRYRSRQKHQQQLRQQAQEQELQQHSSSEGGSSSNNFALGLSFRGPIHALVSAMSVQGDDDEDDWEATQNTTTSSSGCKPTGQFTPGLGNMEEASPPRVEDSA